MISVSFLSRLDRNRQFIEDNHEKERITLICNYANAMYWRQQCRPMHRHICREGIYSFYPVGCLGVWRWLAKKDVEKWLISRISPDSPFFNTMIEGAAATIRKYGDEHSDEEYRHQAESFKRTWGTVAHEPVVVKYYVRKGRIRMDSLMEDGHWYSSVYEEVQVSSN